MAMSVDRGVNGRLKRLPELDLESYHDFLTGFRAWLFRDLGGATRARADALAARETAGGGNLSFARARDLFGGDPMIAVSHRIWVSSQLMAHHSLLDGFRRHGDDVDAWFAAAEASDCGSIALDPNLVIPDYARHEIHIQPGGYVGEPLAGHVYHYGTNSFYLGLNDQDQVYLERAKVIARPEDGRLDRIVDLGCGIGQYPIALKEAFPDAEVWGIEVGAPLVRYTHARAVQLGVPIHVAQRLAERTGFDDASFDVVTAHILFHEVNDQAAHDIVREAWRILRPGGVFDITEFDMDRSFTPYEEYAAWADHFYNGEPWEGDFYNRPFLDWIRQAGFELTIADAPMTRGGLKKYIARKPMQDRLDGRTSKGHCGASRKLRLSRKRRARQSGRHDDRIVRAGLDAQAPHACGRKPAGGEGPRLGGGDRGVRAVGGG
ncbi:class I SAM-dependent methyltransferase [Sphingomonas crocodyli]|uniref:Class I SAM-dependent methyltransferase n=1 Tax=Sphingomonas crocodyli TaxID=1979270 RepID=A0A437LZX6_9SPHN|nr:class I SAM-dependent methyltransferase [Sphingomonas crocodyli]RVT90989.1 class I SAM-dependent methyltransferase [Sphingomonas crocodyli]